MLFMITNNYKWVYTGMGFFFYSYGSFYDDKFLKMGIHGKCVSFYFYSAFYDYKLL